MTDFQCQCKNVARAIEDAADDFELLVDQHMSKYVTHSDYRTAIAEMRKASQAVMQFKKEFE